MWVAIDRWKSLSSHDPLIVRKLLEALDVPDLGQFARYVAYSTVFDVL